jgi:hypothetical protein
LASKQSERLSARQMLDELEEAIEALRIAYEKYFVGVDRVPPTRLHEKVERQLRLAETERFRATALRFRLHGLRARWVTYGHYWTRVLRQIEEGTHRRDYKRTRPAPTPEAASTPEPPVTDSVGVDPDHAREVFRQLVKVKRELGHSLGRLSYGGLFRTLNREATKLREAGSSDVKFEVVVENGRVRLRARGQ